jgi:hypothetical protein
VSNQLLRAPAEGKSLEARPAGCPLDDGRLAPLRGRERMSPRPTDDHLMLRRLLVVIEPPVVLRAVVLVHHTSLFSRSFCVGKPVGSTTEEPRAPRETEETYSAVSMSAVRAGRKCVRVRLS